MANRLSMIETGTLYTTIYHSPICDLFLVAGKNGLKAIEFFSVPRDKRRRLMGGEGGRPFRESPLGEKILAELDGYFNGELQNFSLPLEPDGSPFQKKVWRELCRIPYGQTRSYGEIARRVGTPRGARAVGMANNRNPIPIIIPCHRVLGARGDLVGFRPGLDLKKKLLELEGRRR